MLTLKPPNQFKPVYETECVLPPSAWNLVLWIHTWNQFSSEYADLFLSDIQIQKPILIKNPVLVYSQTGPSKSMCHPLSYVGNEPKNIHNQSNQRVYTGKTTSKSFENNKVLTFHWKNSTTLNIPGLTSNPLKAERSPGGRKHLSMWAPGRDSSHRTDQYHLGWMTRNLLCPDTESHSLPSSSRCIYTRWFACRNVQTRQKTRSIAISHSGIKTNELAPEHLLRVIHHMWVLKWFLYVFTQQSGLMRRHVNISLEGAGSDFRMCVLLTRPPTQHRGLHRSRDPSWRHMWWFGAENNNLLVPKLKFTLIVHFFAFHRNWRRC